MEKLFSYQNELIKDYPGFIYEVEIFKKTYNSWELSETSMYKSNKFISDLVAFSIYKYEGYDLHKFTTLIGAPSAWLKENCKEIDFETAKEKRKRIKDEKELKKSTIK